MTEKIFEQKRVFVRKCGENSMEIKRKKQKEKYIIINGRKGIKAKIDVKIKDKKKLHHRLKTFYQGYLNIR